ncbi:MAG: serine/threonine protein kinase, partial [Polyangiaceae bacterium]|nr:serine/threonine protein kinase [Polyangiaceae bacterium]
GVIHRDLKPANVLVDAGGRITILDFGLSRLDAPRGDALTLDDEVLGTPAYLAPEQIHGDPVTARTDLYAAGVMLYQALSGRLPHEAKDLMGLLRARLTRRPAPVLDLAPGTPPLVAEIIDDLLAIDPSDRPAGADQVLARLRGERLAAEPALPRLDRGEPVRAVIEAAIAGRAVDVVGPARSGKTRCLEEAAQELRRRGRRVIQAAPARRPFASLAPLVGPLEEHASDRLPDVSAAVTRRVVEALAAGAVLVADDAERLDRASADVIAACRGAGAVVRAWTDRPREAAPAGAAADVVLGAFDEGALRSLFAGQDRVLHLREDAARALRARTGGLAGRVAQEVNAWIRAGLARRDGDRFVVDRGALDRLDASAPPLLPACEAPRAAASLPPHLRELLAWVVLARPLAGAALIAAASRAPPWRVEAEIEELIALGAVRALPDGCLEPVVAGDPTDDWPPERRSEAHRSIAGALPRGTRGRLLHLLAGMDDSSHGDAREIAGEAVALARSLAGDGHLGRASAVLEDGLRALRGVARSAPAPGSGEGSTPGHDAEVALLATWLEIALSDWTPRAIDRVLYELCRVDPATEAVLRLQDLARAALAIVTDAPRALAIVEALPPLGAEGLELRRQSVRMVAARGCSAEREEQTLARVAEWAARRSDAPARARLCGWRGRVCYRQGRYEEAAALHGLAADQEAWAVDRIAARLNAASALLEAFRHEEAASAASDARGLAARCRHAYLEARAEWILSAASYRRASRASPDLELVEAVAALGISHFEGLVCATEAAVAWRASMPDLAVDLARRAERRWAGTGINPELSALMRCLAIACGAPAPGGEVERLAEAALVWEITGMGIQALGLLGGARPELRPRWASRAPGLAARIDRRFWGLRMDVLSVAESLAGLGVEAGELVSK